MNSPAAHALGLSSDPSPAQIAGARAGLAGPVRQASEKASRREQAMVLTCADGRARTVACRIEPMTVDGRTVGSVVVVSGRSPRIDRPVARPRGPSTRAAAEPRASRPRYSFSDILGESPALQDALRLARAVARRQGLKPTMILGESGTGKEVLAHAIHSESERADKPFVAVNCGALPRELVESELFGYSSGAFTGARREGQAGKFEAAQGGTIFLDEVDSMPMEVQAKLLRVIETNEVVRLGQHPAHRPRCRHHGRLGTGCTATGREWAVPPRPVSPAERGRDRHAPAARAQRRHPDAGRRVPGS